jgi:hypothetical protein
MGDQLTIAELREYLDVIAAQPGSGGGTRGGGTSLLVSYAVLWWPREKASTSLAALTSGLLHSLTFAVWPRLQATLARSTNSKNHRENFLPFYANR